MGEKYDNCGHNHSHHYEQDDNVKISIHDGAVVSSETFVIHGNFTQISNRTSQEMDKLSKLVVKQGGVVGHIKAFVEITNYTMLSMTNDQVQSKQGESDTKVSINTIVFNILPDELKTMITKLKHDLNKKE